jgi:hypothetical protein
LCVQCGAERIVCRILRDGLHRGVSKLP